MKKGRFEDVSFDSMECYTSTFKRLIWEEHIKKTIIVIISPIFFLFTGFVFLAIMVPLVYFFSFLEKARKSFLKDFTDKNNLEYKESISLSELKGNLFKVGNSRKATNVITGTYNEKKARFFHYQYSIGTGRNRTTYNFTVLEVFFDGIVFPHMLLQSRKMRRFGLRERKDVNISLEEEFKKDYNLFIRDGYGTEAMQIFTKDFLRFLKKEKSDFSIELKEDRICIYDDTFVYKKEQLKELYEVTEGIISRIGPLLKRMKNDFDALNPYFN